MLGKILILVACFLFANFLLIMFLKGCDDNNEI